MTSETHKHIKVTKKLTSIITLVLFVLFFNNCTNQVGNSSSNTNNIIYQSGFENTSDLEGWEGVERKTLDSFAYEGKSSLLISGGCIQPTAKYTIVLKEDGDYSISFYAKLASENQSARVVLACTEDLASYTAEVEVRGNAWKSYQSSKTHFVKGDKLCIYVYVGGIIAESINIDKLILRKD